MSRNDKRSNSIKYGICTNMELKPDGTMCSLCQKKEKQAIRSTKEFICAECRAPLTEVTPPKPRIPRIIIIFFSIVLLAVAVVIGIIKHKSEGVPPRPSVPYDTIPPTVTPPCSDSLPAKDTIRDTVYITDTSFVVKYETITDTVIIKTPISDGGKAPSVSQKAKGHSNLTFGTLDGSLSYDNNATIKVTRQHTMYLKDANQSTIAVSPGDELRQCRIRNGILESFQVIRQDGNRESILDAYENLK